jgi:hypothetical protein
MVGVTKESLEAFRAALENRTLMAAASELAAAAVARIYGSDAIGINPFGEPRLDEGRETTEEQRQELARFAFTEQEEGSTEELSAGVLDGGGYGVAAEQFQLHPTMPWFGMWAVANEWKKASDLPSIKEHWSYEMLERPYKFLQSTDKKKVDEETLGATTLVRKQVPVLVDFNEGRVYIESTNKKLIYKIVVKLSSLGAEIFPVAWIYDRPNWVEEILSRLYAGTQFADEFMKRAEEAKRFRPNEIEKLEDREMEKIVASFFSMTQLPGELWVGISGPARIRLDDASPEIGVRSVTSATTLLHMTDEAAVVSGALTFQDRVTYESKDGGTRTVRKDLLRAELNDRINLTDVGAAMLRGFDISSHRKDVQREIRQSKLVPSIMEFWGGWLHQLSNAVRTMEGAFREVLELDANERGGIVAVAAPEKEDEKKLVTA